MRIAIDISSIVYGTGVSVYTRNLVKALAEVDKQNEYVLFGGSLRQRQIFEEFYQLLKQRAGAENFSLKTLPFSPKMQTVVWNDWNLLPLEWLLGKVDVYHSPDWSLAPSQARTVITVHDLFFLKRPDLQVHPYKETLERRLRRAADSGLTAIAVSEATKNDLMELLDYPENLVTVIYEAVDEEYNSTTKEQKSNPPAGGAKEQVLKKYGVKEPYLLMVGTLEPRKNLKRTLEAFSVVSKNRTDNLQLVIAGKVGWGEQLEKVQNVNLAGYVDRSDLPVLFAEARGFLYPSLYEGFGLPILTAFECGCPVLTSEVSSMPEVAGKAAIYVDPTDVNSISKGMEKLISLKDKERKQLIESGYKQMQKFSWKKAAEKTLEVYKTI